jgi:hypothetical protein
MVWILVWKYIFEPFIHILQHIVLQLSRSTNLFLGPAAVLLKNPKCKKQPWKIWRENLRFDSIFYNNAPVFKRTFACPRLKNYFPSFQSSLYIRTNIYWQNSSLFSMTHPTFLHSWRFRRSTEHILFRTISLVGKIFGTFLACSSLRTANPFCIERPIKQEF